ncbi:unnamed protein product [Penicillium pancosmium]
MSQLRSIPRALKLPLKQLQVPLQHRPFTQTHSTHGKKPLPPRLKLNDEDLSVAYLKGTGPGGQKINKTNSAVQISHKPTGIVIKCQATRSQSQNHKIARSLLADRVEAHLKGDQSPSRVSIKAEAARKKKASKVKKARRKYRGLEGESAELEAEEGGEDDGEVVLDADAGERASEDGVGGRGIEEDEVQKVESRKNLKDKDESL